MTFDVGLLRVGSFCGVILIDTFSFLNSDPTYGCCLLQYSVVFRSTSLSTKHGFSTYSLRPERANT